MENLLRPKTRAVQPMICVCFLFRREKTPQLCDSTPFFCFRFYSILRDVLEIFLLHPQGNLPLWGELFVVTRRQQLPGTVKLPWFVTLCPKNFGNFTDIQRYDSNNCGSLISLQFPIIVAHDIEGAKCHFTVDGRNPKQPPWMKKPL